MGKRPQTASVTVNLSLYQAFELLRYATWGAEHMAEECVKDSNSKAADALNVAEHQSWREVFFSAMSDVMVIGANVAGGDFWKTWREQHAVEEREMLAASREGVTGG